MSKIDDLIKKYCPNGVQFMTFEEVCDYEQPGKYIVESTNYSDDYTTPVLTAGQTFILGYTDETEGIYQASKSNPVIIFDDFTGAFKWVDFPFKVKSSAMKLLTPNGKALLRYIFHYMGCLNFSSDEHKRLWIATYSKFKIPVPPLEVQREIVQVLDSFTMLTAELSAELSARKKQYEYYRDQLLSFNNVRGGLTFANPESVRWMTLGECCDMKAGKAISSVNIYKEPTKEASIPCYGGNGLRGFVSESNQNGNFCLIGRQGALCGNVCYATGKFYATEHAVVVKNNTSLNSRFLFHLLTNMNLNQYKSQGAQPGLAVGKLEEIKIPVPSLAIQDKIANVLDNFDSICSDLQIGLPAEIDARKKQYEYYRDLLLSFEPIGTVLAKQASKQASKQAIISLYQYVYGYVEIMLGEVATISRGGNFQKKDFAESGVPCIHYGQIYTRYGLYADKTISSISNEAAQKQKFAQPNDIVMAVTSENVEDVCKCVAWVGNEPIAVSGHSAIIHHNQNAKFLTYYFHTSMFLEQKRKLAHGTKVIEVTPDKLNGVKIPLPSLAEQERIVAVLDKFDALVNDLSEGLPAEIEARKRQYEYYRDKLLSFKKIA